VVLDPFVHFQIEFNKITSRTATWLCTFFEIKGDMRRTPWGRKVTTFCVDKSCFGSPYLPVDRHKFFVMIQFFIMLDRMKVEGRSTTPYQTATMPWVGHEDR
jgi:hypothetical protein